MEENKRWIVTYTKHLRQKRKVYQDGLLELDRPSNKVLLYDDSGKLLDSRYLKKDDLIECGVTISFETHLVDIGDLDETQKSLQNFTVSNNDGKSNERPVICGPNSRNSCVVKESQPKSHGSTNVHLHDSQVTKRGNKRIELQTNSRVQNQPNSTAAITREWDVLYTAQITQKAKRYHDGILKLVSCGSHMNQLILFKEDGSTLSSNYQKSAECLGMGNTYEMPNYLVEICKQRNIEGDAVDKNRESHLCIQKDRPPSTTKGNMKENQKPVLQNSCTLQNCASSEKTNVTGIEESKYNPLDKEVVIRSSGVSTKSEEVLKDKPFRDAFQILSFLKRQPQENLVTEKLLVDQTFPSQSLDLFHSDLQSSRDASLKSVTSPEITPSHITKLAYPVCEVELLTDDCSASSSLLHGKELCRTSVHHLAVESTEKDFPDVETPSICSETSDTATGLSGRICIEESLGSHLEDKSNLGLHSIKLQIVERRNHEKCKLHSDNANSEEGYEGVPSSAASSLGCATTFPSVIKASDINNLPRKKVTEADDFPSFDLGI